MKNVTALARATMATMTLVTVITIAGEYMPALKDGLASVTGHHWVTKGVLATVVFFAGYAALSGLSKGSSREVSRSTIQVVVCAAINGLVLTGFFVMHYLQTH